MAYGLKASSCDPLKQRYMMGKYNKEDNEEACGAIIAFHAYWILHSITW